MKVDERRMIVREVLEKEGIRRGGGNIAPHQNGGIELYHQGENTEVGKKKSFRKKRK